MSGVTPAPLLGAYIGHMKRWISGALFGWLLAAGLAASSCGGYSSSGPSGNVVVMLRDSPFSDARAVLVTFSEVSVHRSGEGGFTTIPLADGASSRTCDLKKLVGAQDVLGTGSLDPGHYTQIRLTVTSGAVYFDAASSGPACAATIAPPAGQSAPVEVSSGEVKLNREFDVSAAATTITLDFDGDRSIIREGNGRYRMTPVIAVVSVG